VSHRRGPRLFWVGTAAALPLLGPAAAASAADTTPDTTPAAPAGVTVEVLGGDTPAVEGAAIDYTIEIRDDGPVPDQQASVTALLPPGFRILHADPAADDGAGSPTWTVDLAPGHPVDIRAEVAAGSVQDLAETPAPLTDPGKAVKASKSADAAWYSLSACVRGQSGDPPMCGLTQQLLIKRKNDVRGGVESIGLMLGAPLAAAGACYYVWRRHREPRLR